MAKIEISNLARTPLFDLVVEQKAKLTPFAGWEMPVQFTGVKQEHEAVRTSVGMFDISHMGKFALSGQDLLKQLQFLVPSDLERLQSGQAQYTVLLNSSAGIVDDIIFYYQGENLGVQQGIMIVNAATTSLDKDWLLSHLKATEITLQDLSPEKVLIAIQGSQAITKLQAFVADDLSKIKAFGHIESTVFGESAFIARTGYTGEDGFEVMVNPEVGQKLWRFLLTEGVVPCGLGSRDTLRLEAAMPLYGQDIDENTTPLEAGLGWIVHWDTKGDFLGKQVLEAEKAGGLKRRLVGLQMKDKYIARHGYPVLFNQEVVGQVTSGTLSPTLGYAIALAYVPVSLAKIGQTLAVEIRGKSYLANVVKKPFYRSSSRLNNK